MHSQRSNRVVRCGVIVAIAHGFTWIVVVLLTGLTTASQSAPPHRPTDLKTYRDAARHFTFQYPKEWKIDAEGGHAMHYKTVLVALNNLGKEKFYLREQQTSSTLWELNDKVVARLLPAGSAYLEISWWEGPPTSKSIGEYTDMASDDLTRLLQETKEDASGRRTLSFSKWGKSWEVTAYLRPPVKQDVRQAMERVLSSIRFDAVPAGESEWAVMQAYRLLPPEANPSKFIIRGGSGNQSVSTRRVADDVIVTFTHDDGQPNRNPVRRWIYHVDSQGHVNAVAPEDVEQLVNRIKNTVR